MSPRISIVMPCYNVAPFLDYALLGIENQLYKNFQLIAVNDGSTDSTLEKLENLEAGFDVKIVQSSSNLGLPDALNLGLSNVDGDLIARFDPDDFMQEWRLKDQVHYLLENIDVDLVGGGAVTFGTENTEMWPQTSHQDIVNEFLLNNPFIHPTVMFRRKLLDEGLLFYRPGFSTDEDYELWSRLLPKIKTGNIGYNLIKYRMHSSNGQRNPGKKAVKELAINQFLKAYGVENPALARVLAEYQCSQFLTHRAFTVMKDYVSQKRKVPRLGRIHERLSRARNYADFTADMW